MVRHTLIARLLFIMILLGFSAESFSKPSGTVRGNISLYLYQGGTGSEKTGVNTINAQLGDIITVEVFARNLQQVPVSGLEVYLTVDERYFSVVSQGKNLVKGTAYYGQPKPYLQGQYLSGASGSVPVYGNNTHGDTLLALDNGLQGWQLNYVELTGADTGFGRPVSRLKYGVVATFQLIAKAPCDSAVIKLDTDQYHARVSRYLDPTSADSYFYSSFASCYISVSGLKISPPLPDLYLAAGSADSTLSLNEHVGISSIPDSLLTWTAKQNNNISVYINPKTHIVTFTSPSGFHGFEDIVFTVKNSDGTITASDTLRVLVDGPPKLLSDAVPAKLIVHEDSLEAVLDLRNIVEDADDDFTNLTWFFRPASSKVTPSAANDSLFLKGILNFNGNETLRISVYDSFGMGDSLSVPVEVLPANDPPVMNKIPDLTIERNQSFILNLSNYASDVDNDNLTVSWKEPDHLAFTKSGMQVTISGDSGFLGSERIYLTVTDPGGLSASDSLRVTFTPAHNPPVWSKIPKMGFPQNGADSSLVIWDYVSDPDDSGSQLTFVFANLDDVDSVFVNQDTGRVTFYDLDNITGWDRLTVTAFDPDGNNATTQFSVFIGPADGTPIVAGIPDTTIVAGTQTSWIDLDDYYYDVDNTDSQMEWSWGRQANTDSSVSVYINPMNHTVILQGLSSEKYGINRIFFTATDPGGKFGDDICIVSAIALNRPVLDLPVKVGFVAGSSYRMDLYDYVYDTAFSKSELSWSWSGNSNTVIALETPDTSQKCPVSFSGSSSWKGWERVSFTVMNPLSGSAQDTLLVFSVSSDGSPVAGGLGHVTMKAGGSVLVNLDDYYYDADSADSQMTWSVSGGDSVVVGINPLTHIATISAPSESWEGQNTITFTVTDPEGNAGSMQTVVTVNDAVLRNAFSVSILRNPMQEDYMDMYVKSVTDLLATPSMVVRTAKDSTTVKLVLLETRFYCGHYLLPLSCSLGVKGMATIDIQGKTATGKNVSAAKSFAYGRIDSSGGKIALGKLSLDIPGDALAKPEFITIIPGKYDGDFIAKEASGEVILTDESCTVGPASMRPQKSLILGIVMEESSGAGIYRMKDGVPEYIGGDSSNGMVTAPITGSGTYRVGYDRTPPRLRLLQDGEREVEFTISECGSGIDRDSIHVMRGGVAMQWRFDESRSVIIVGLSGTNGGESLEIAVSDRSGNRVLEKVSVNGAAHPFEIVVEQNSPNPFNPKTDIAFSLTAGCDVIVEIYDLIGRRVTVLARGNFPAGRHTLTWDSRDARGLDVSSGVYFYRVTAGAKSVTRKMLFLR